MERATAAAYPGSLVLGEALVRVRKLSGMVKINERCFLCRESLKPGYLWIGGKDYLECPDCNGTARFLMIEERIQPPPTRVFLAGLTRVS